MRAKKRIISWFLVGSCAVSTCALTPGIAAASAKGRRTTAIILGGATVYSILQRKPVQSLVLGGATYYAYRNYRRAKDRRVARRSWAHGYRAGVRAARTRRRANLRAASASRRAAVRTAGYRSTYRRPYRRR
jgi:hypothetical protein